MSQKPFIRTLCVATVAVGVLGTGGCGTTMTTQESPFTEPEQSALLRVENHSFDAAQVYLIWNTTMRVPLGSVEAMDSRIWKLPPRRVADEDAEAYRHDSLKKLGTSFQHATEAEVREALDRAKR